MQAGRLPHRNPTAYVFEGSVGEVHERVAEALRVHEAPDRVFGERLSPPHAEVQFADYFVVEDARDPTFGSDILSDPGNENDLYVHTYGDPLWLSPVYRGRRGGLPFIAAFHVHVASKGEDGTLVNVRAINPEVRNGMVWGLGSCGPGYAWHQERVAPTTVEEYALLRYFGRTLGAVGMPEMALP